LPIPVTVLGDTTVEPTETFTVTLTSPTNAVLADGTATGTITNDDVPAGPLTATFTVAAGADDVNEEATTLTADGSSVWVGNGSSATASFAGFRFTGVTLPPGATITAAQLELTAAATQWISLNYEFAAEAAASSAPFSTTSRPSQRALLAPRVVHASNVQWVTGTRYPLDSLTPLLQAVVDQPGWTSGNALALVLRGTGQAWARKHARAFEAGAAFAPRLVVSYTLPAAP